MVSEANAATGGFLLNVGRSHGTLNVCMTKSTAVDKYNLASINLSSYTDNQLIPKSAWVNGVVADTTPPSTPTNFVGTSQPGFIDFGWNASTDNIGVEFYEIYRNDVWYDETAYTGWSDYTEDTVNRTYKVRAVDANLNRSAFSTTITKRASFNFECFVKGTLISLSNGTQVPIELLELNQLLLSSEIETLQDTNNVNELYLWSNNELVEKRISSPINKIEKRTADKTIIINNGVLEATPEHSQLIKRNGIWKFTPIGEVVIGDYLYNVNAEEIEITSVDINTETRNIYPMSLSPSHTYFANGILTHNVK